MTQYFTSETGELISERAVRWLSVSNSSSGWSVWVNGSEFKLAGTFPTESLAREHMRRLISVSNVD